jgi:hypothetical protein
MANRDAGFAPLVAFACLPALCSAQDSTPVVQGGPATFGTTVVVPGGLRGEAYNLPDGSFKLPNFEKLKPAGTIYTAELNIYPRDFLEGFPGVTDRIEWFAIDYKGRFWVDKPGPYKFFLESDDGSRLYIDDKLAIDNDGLHSAQTINGGAKLTYGIHRIRVSYFQGPGAALALVLAVARPDGPWRVFNTNEFKPPPNPDDWAGLAALHTDPLPRDFEFRLAAVPFHNQAASWQAALVLDAPALPARLHLLALVKTAQGNVAGRYALDPPAESQNHPVTWTQVLELAPGRYTVEAVAVDRDGKRASAATIPIDTPPPHPGIDISRVMLAQLAEPADDSPSDPLVYQGRRVVPILAPVWNAAAKPSVYFVVYPDKRNPAKPMLRVEFLVDGQRLAANSADLPPDTNGSIPVFVEAAALPGNCELRITAMQGSDSANGSVRYAVPR